MADRRLRELERRLRASGAVVDEVSLLLERVRAGRLALARLRLAAALGHPAAALAAAAVEASGPTARGGPGPTVRREPHPEDYPEVRPPSAEERARFETSVGGGGRAARLRAMLEQGVIVQPKSLPRSVEDVVFEAAAACGPEGLLRLALAAARCAGEDLLASHVAEHARDDDLRALVTAAELRLCGEVERLAESAAAAGGGPWPSREARALMRALELAVERNRELVRQIRVTGPDFGYTTRWIIACYLLADLLAVDDALTRRCDARDVVSHAEGYFLELWTPHDGNSAPMFVDDAVLARAGAHVLGAVREAVVPWALGG